MATRRGAGPGRGRTCVAARRPSRGALAGLLVSNLVSVAGGGFSVVALPWFVLATTGSAVATGVTVLCETVPLVAVSLVAGALVDRVGAKATRVGSDVLSALTVLAVPVLHATVGIAFWQLLVLVALNGAARAPAPAASLVLLTALAADGGSSGDRERALYAAGVRLATVLGAPLGGALIAWRGAPFALVADAATFAVSALVLVATVRLPASAAVRPDRVPAPVRPWAGVAVLAGDRLLRATSGLVVALAALSGAWIGVLAPAYGLHVLRSPTALGLLVGVSGAGALAGNLVSPWLAARTGHHRLVWTCLAVGTVPAYGVPALTTVVPVLAVAVFVAGVGTGVLGPLWLGLLTTRTGAQQHGHVFGVAFALEQAGVAAGALVGGLLLERLGVTATLAGTAAAGAALAVLAALAPALRAPESPGEGS